MTQDIQQLEQRLKQIEQTAEKKEIEQRLEEAMKDYKGEDEVISFKDVKMEIDSPDGLTGISKLDSILNGFRKGNLIVITGPTGQGKTTLLQTFTINLSKQGLKSLWFTYEVPIQSLLRKFGSDIPDGYVPKVVTETSIIWIERKIVEAIVKFGIKAVFIDPFNSLKRFSTNKLSQELGDLAEQLKQIALKYSIILFVSAHARRLMEGELVYSEDSIRDTALLGNKADTVISLWRNKKIQKKEQIKENGIIFTNETTISVAKNRFNGMLGSLKVMYSENKFLLSDPNFSNLEIQEEIPEDYVNF